jgi:hypothetical protein
VGPEILIRRLVNGATVRLRAELDTALQPSDSVEVIGNDIRADVTVPRFDR